MQSIDDAPRFHLAYIKWFALSAALCFGLVGCQYSGAFEDTQCSKPSDCTGEAVCISGYCKLLETPVEPDVNDPPDIDQTPDTVDPPDTLDPPDGESAVSSVEIIGPSELNLGEEVQLELKIQDEYGVDIEPDQVDISWRVYAGSPGDVDDSGLFRASQPGDAFVMATVDGITEAHQIHIVEASVARVELACEQGSDSVDCDELGPISIGESLQVTATLFDDQGQELSDAPLEWRSDNLAVAAAYAAGAARPYEGRVLARSVGSATIAASSGGASAAFDLEVEAAEPGSPATLELFPQKLTLPVGESYQLEAVAYDSEGTKLSGLDITWAVESGNDSVEFEGDDGTLRAKEKGSAEISASVAGIQETLNVEVSRSGAISPQEATLEVGQTVQMQVLDAYLEPESSVDSWESGDADIADVNSDGEVRAKSPGDAEITAHITRGSESYEYTARITVNEQKPVRIEVSPSYINLVKGEEKTITDLVDVKFLAANGDELNVASPDWSSDDENIVEVDSSTLKAKAQGVTFIKVNAPNYSDIKGYITVLVLAPTALPATFSTRANTKIKENAELQGRNRAGEDAGLEFYLLDDSSPPELVDDIESEQGGTVKILDKNTGEFIFEPKNNYVGKDTFKFVVKDGDTVSDPATVTVFVQPYARITFKGVNEDDDLKFTGLLSIGSGKCSWQLISPDPSSSNAELILDEDSNESDNQNTECAQILKIDDSIDTYHIQLTYEASGLSDTAELLFSLDD